MAVGSLESRIVVHLRGSCLDIVGSHRGQIVWDPAHSRQPKNPSCKVTGLSKETLGYGGRGEVASVVWESVQYDQETMTKV